MIYQGTTSQILDHENSWIGSIPSSWKIVRLQRYLYLQNGYPFDSTHFNSFEGIRLVRIRDLTDGGTETYFDGQVPSHSLIDDGDLLVGMDGDFNVCWWQGGKAVLNQRLCCLHSLVGLDKRFLFYLLPWPLKIINDLTYFTTVKHLSSSQILKIKAPLPSLDEQRYIAAYLDRKTDVIDSVIQKKQRLIELLREKRQALITQAVTKGLDPSVPMKGSGIGWLGEIPSHWEMAPVWTLFRLGRGRVISNLEIQDNQGPYPVYSSQTENQGVMGCIDTYDFEGDYLTWTTDGANAGTVFRRQGKFNCTNVCGTMSAISPDTTLVYYQFLLNQATGFYVRQDINPKLMNGVMARIRVPVPPTKEQVMIGQHLSETTTRVDDLISTIEHQITKLHEYRQTLISAAVTGKIDVREEVAACL